MSFAIPEILTPSNWNRNKGVIIKLRKSDDGITAALTKLQVEYRKLPVNDLDPNIAAGRFSKTGKVTLAGFTQAYQGFKANKSRVKPFVTHLKLLEKQLKDIELKWKASKLIPASTRKHVGLMRLETTKWILRLSDQALENLWRNSRIKVAENEERLRDIALKLIKPYFSSIRANAVQVKKLGTVAAYEGGQGKGFHQNIRGLNASLDRTKRTDWIMWKDQHWKPLSQDSFKPQRDSEVAAKVDQVLDVLTQLERVVQG